MSNKSSASSILSNATLHDFIHGLDLAVIRDLAIAARRASPGVPEPPDGLSCHVVTPAKSGSYNVVFELDFSDGVSWVIRIPIDEWDPIDARCMNFDIIAMEYIVGRTSVPIPRVHAYSSGVNNALGRPYMLMDKVHGTPLVDVWNDPAWWTGDRRRENLFDSLAGYMVELASLQFDKIGRLDRVKPDGDHVIAPFPSGIAIIGAEGAHEDFGPFATTHAYLTELLALRRKTGRTRNVPPYALLQLFIGALPNSQLDAGPFTFGHPDYDLQNVFVDDKTGRVVGIIDWDGVTVQPPELGALAYPAWLTHDWNPAAYDFDFSQPQIELEIEMHTYRRMYTEAVRRASEDKEDQAAVTSNSHVVYGLFSAITSPAALYTVIYRLGEYAFGSSTLTSILLEEIEHSAWYKMLSGDAGQKETWAEVASAGNDAVEHAQKNVAVRSVESMELGIEVFV
ncbi:hypothetical protein FKP32DRAFT_1679786 [Trametes sanguinea]|nr:hypothetical protein FKP32DRAFT_1679786 [Trametes sanguinea]